jgi:hypothetical protein
MEWTFGEWFDLFVTHLTKLGYDGPIDHDQAQHDFHQENDPIESATEFYQNLKP